MDSGSLVFSVVPEEESLGQKSLDGKQSGTLNGKTTAKKSSRKESKTESLTTPQYSAMCEHSPVKGTPENIEEWLMLSVEDSHANHLVSQEQEKQEMIPEIGHTDLKPLEMGKFHSQWLQPMQSYLRSLLKND